MQWSKIQYVTKCVVKRYLIGSSTWVIGPLADLSGFHSIYEIDRRHAHGMPTKFVNILETSKVLIRGQYLDSVSYALLHFITSRLCENLAPDTQSEIYRRGNVENSWKSLIMVDHAWKSQWSKKIESWLSSIIQGFFFILENATSNNNGHHWNLPVYPTWSWKP